LGDLPQPYSDVGEQARATLTILCEQFAFERWMISRLDADQLVVEYVEPASAELTPGTSFPWSHTLCARMVYGEGPAVAPSVAAVPAYAAAPLCRQLGLGAYAGAPIYDQEGRLWGTVCAMHPTALPEESRIDESYLHWIARSLATHLAAASPASTPDRHFGPSAIFDAPVWTAVLDKEDERCVRTGQQACVLELEVASGLADNSVGPDLSTVVDDAARVVAASARGCDFLSRTGTTRLRLLAVNCPAESAPQLMKRLVADLADAAIRAQAAVVELLPRTGAITPKTVEPSTSITYMVCGECNRRGAYISPRFPVLRCKYCGLRLPLSGPEWHEALRNAR
jgi:hypothetical protein